jgi:hypothetical protein
MTHGGDGIKIEPIDIVTPKKYIELAIPMQYQTYFSQISPDQDSYNQE